MSRFCLLVDIGTHASLITVIAEELNMSFGTIRDRKSCSELPYNQKCSLAPTSMAPSRSRSTPHGIGVQVQAGVPPRTNTPSTGASRLQPPSGLVLPIHFLLLRLPRLLLLPHLHAAAPAMVDI